MKSSSSPFALLLFLGTARKSCQHLLFSLRRGLSLSPLSRLAAEPWCPEKLQSMAAPRRPPGSQKSLGLHNVN